MKNFRKVLALVLVVATLFSFTAMTSAANYGEYEDWSKVSYAEAVDVLSAVGILNGYEDDTFKPTNTISREEMAKMIAVLANAGDDVSTLYASASTFADVAKDRWSASYVAYCAKTGIVAGRSASTFDPTGKVTGLETAKMLLVVLGFDAKEQGYVGADWKVNVLRDAKVMGLTNNFAADYDIDVAITREEAAQMMLNALEAPCVVGILSDGIVTLTNALVTNWGKLDGNSTIAKLAKITAYAKLKDAMDAGEWCLYGNVVISNDTLASTLYNGLKKAQVQQDCYGRPATVWTWTNSKGVTTTLAESVATPVWSSYNTNADAIAAKVAEYKNLKLARVDYVDGKLETVNGGKGALVEVFVLADKIIVTEINTYVGELEHVDTLNNKVQVTITKANGSTETLNKAKNVWGFTTADCGKELLVWKCGTAAKDIHDVEVAEYETLTLHGGWAEAGKFCDTADNYYEYSANNVSGTVAAANAGKTLKVLTDKYGYVLKHAVVGATTNYTVLVATSAKWYENSGNHFYSEATYDAQFVEFADNAAPGERIAIDLPMYNIAGASMQLGAVDHLVAYTENANGKRFYKAEGHGITTAPEGEYYLQKGTGEIDGLNYFGNEETQYILRVYNYLTGEYEYKYFDGKSEIDATYELTRLQYTTTKAHSTATFLKYVYAEAEYAKASAMAFVTGKYSSEFWITEGDEVIECVLYKGYVNGEEAYLALEKDQVPADTDYNSVWTASWKQIGAESHNGLPIYKAFTAATTSVGYDFFAKAGTLYYKTAAGAEVYVDLDAEATIVVITEVDGVMTADVKTADELINYLTIHNWEQEYGWMMNADSDADYDLLYVYVSGTTEA